MIKRAFDLTACLLIAPVALPLCGLLLIAIRVESPGSPLFVQTRVGRDREPFRMFKLRTMHIDTTDLPSHHVAAAQITRLGRWLRRLKLDELPQLLNVIGGSMALVGPRPCLFSQTELIAERDGRGLFGYRPGVTGPAQLLGVDMSEPARLAEVEAAYFHRARLAEDMSIMIRTVVGAGAGDAALKPRS